MALEPSAVTPAQWTAFIEQFAESTKAGMIAAAENHDIQIQFFVDEAGRAFVDCEFDMLVQLNAFDVVETNVSGESVVTDSQVNPEVITTTVTDTIQEVTTTDTEVSGEDIVTESTTVRGAQTVTSSQVESGSQTATHPNSSTVISGTGSDSTVENMTYTEIT